MASIRRAAPADLPAIHSLIRSSFAAVGDHYPPHVAAAFSQQAECAITDGDLAPAAFPSLYCCSTSRAPLSLPCTVNACWVAVDDSTGRIVGCVALKALPTAGNAELVRMAVDATLRGGGVGRALVDALEQHARAAGVQCVRATTCNPRSAQFYALKCDFTLDSMSIKCIGDKTAVLRAHHLYKSLTCVAVEAAPSCECNAVQPVAPAADAVCVSA